MSGSSNNTSFDVDAVQRAAQQIGQLMNDTSAFQNLSGQNLNAGSFDTALWLQEITQNRQQALLLHTQDLDTALQDIAANLRAVVTDLQGTDGQNAAAAQQIITRDMRNLDTELGQDAPELGYGTSSSGTPGPVNLGVFGPSATSQGGTTNGGQSTQGGTKLVSLTSDLTASGQAQAPGQSLVPGQPLAPGMTPLLGTTQSRTGETAGAQGAAVPAGAVVPASKSTGTEAEEEPASQPGTTAEPAEPGVPASPAATSVPATSIKTVAEPAAQAPAVYTATADGFTVPSGDVNDWIQQAISVLQANGVPVTSADSGLIATIIQHESSGNHSAVNLSDANALAGHPSIGLMQCIDSTFNAYKISGYDDIQNPVDNIIAGVRYALARYGSLANVPGVESLSEGGSYVGY